MTIKEFIEMHELTAQITARHDNPNMPDSGDMYHYDVAISDGYNNLMFVGSRVDHNTGKSYMTAGPVYFSVGTGWTEKPTLADVLDCLASDAATVENCPDFETWANELGYDEDSRKAYQCWELITARADAMRADLGDEAYNALLWDVERM